MARSQNSVRITVSLPGGDHADLLDTAEQHDVSLPRLARRTVEECLKNYRCGGGQLVLYPPHDDDRRQE